ncbi:hypothetical protein [Niastella populi]|nr:hypothetical protein [Niastella populi]
MKYPVTLLTLFFLACSTPGKKEKQQIKKNTNEEKSIPRINTTTDEKWATYIDTINMGFVVSYRYPPNYVSEHFENAACIGKPVTATGDGPGNTMDCSLWMEDISNDNIRSVDTLIKYQMDNAGESVLQSKDSITIADVKGLSVIVTGKNEGRRFLKQMVYFTKYNTFFTLINDSLSQRDFQTFIKSLQIEKTN